MDKQIVTQSYNGMLLDNIKKHTIVFNNMDKSYNNYAEKEVRQKKDMYYVLYIQFEKM